ncbi:MAG: hypothetical protein QG635_969 [Bacteroidota bacterium]|nr:hypothetical protein [Bacteroidota bacterium]
MVKFWSSIIEKINKTNPAIIAIAILMIFLITGWLSARISVIACDMSEFLNNPVRILYGDLPYRDFWLLFSPGEVYIPAIIYKLFGINIDKLMFSMVLASALTGLLAFYLGRLILKNNAISALFSFLLFFHSVILNYESPAYIHLYLTFLLLSSFFVIKYIISAKKSAVFIAGFFGGCALFFRIYEVGAALFGIFSAFVIYQIITKKSFKDTAYIILIGISGLIIAPILTLIAFYSIAPKMLSEIVIQSVSNGTSMNLPLLHNLFRLFEELSKDFQQISDGNVLVSTFKFIMRLILIIPTLVQIFLVFIGSFILVIYLRTKPDKMELSIVLVLFLWGLISFPKGLGRSDVAHFAPSVAPMALSILLIYKYNKKSADNKLIKLVTLVILFLLVIKFAQPYYRLLNTKWQPLYTVKIEKGTIHHKNHDYLVGIDSTLNFISKNTQPGDYIFVTPWDAPPFYALTERRNPTYYDSMNDPVVQPAIVKELGIIKDLTQTRTKYIIHKPDWGYDDNPKQVFFRACPLLQRFIDSNYTLVKEYNIFGIYQLNRN